jgi:flagellin-specific chaperone FliS
MFLGVTAYQNNRVLTASPWELVDMLYSAAIARIDEGKLQRAKQIVEQGLYAGLNPGVPMAKDYAKVYDVVLEYLDYRETAPVARKMLQELQEGWRGIKDKN